MCRFAAYIGKTKILMADLMTRPKNSLVYQKHMLLSGQPHVINADGFGMGWYNHDIDQNPAVYRAIQPVWNDLNLKHLASKIQSNCMVGHIRAASIGDVNVSNCHPFFYKNLMMVHNGIVKGFNQFKKAIVAHMSSETFNLIRGNTDTEFLFFMICSTYYETFSEHPNGLEESVIQTLRFIETLDHEHKTTSRINLILTDGEKIVATRWSSKPKDDELKVFYKQTDTGTIIASECLDQDSTSWKELPPQHLISVDVNAVNKINTIQ